MGKDDRLLIKGLENAAEGNPVGTKGDPGWIVLCAQPLANEKVSPSQICKRAFV